MKSKIICEMSGQDIKMLMMLFLYFFCVQCSIASSFCSSIYSNRLIDFWEGKKPLEAGLDGRRSRVLQTVRMGDLRMKTSLQKKRVVVHF